MKFLCSLLFAIVGLVAALTHADAGNNLFALTTTNHPYEGLTDADTLLIAWDPNQPSYFSLGIKDFQVFGESYAFDELTPAFTTTGGSFGAQEDKDSTVFMLGAFMVELTQRSSTAILLRIEGTTPNRIVKMEWKDVGVNGDAENYVNFQQWLYEGSSKIEFHMGPHSIKGDFPFGPNIVGPLVGIHILSTKEADQQNPVVDAFFIAKNPDNPELIHDYKRLQGVPKEGTVYTLSWSPATTVPEALSDISVVQLSPHPVSSDLRVSFASKITAPVTLELVDILGNTMRSLYKGTAQAGENTIRGNVEGINPGLYFVRIQSIDLHVMKQCIIYR